MLTCPLECLVRAQASVVTLPLYRSLLFAMAFTIQQLIRVLDLFFPLAFSARNALYLLGALARVVPLLRLHENQIRRRRNARPAWLTGIKQVLQHFSIAQRLPEPDIGDANEARICADYLADDVQTLAEWMELADNNVPLIPSVPLVLTTPRVDCPHCSADGAPKTLRRREAPQLVHIIGADFVKRRAQVVKAHCVGCKANFYPDRYTFPRGDESLTRFEPDPACVRISKPDKLWVHCDLMTKQEAAFSHLHCGWSSFSNFANESRQEEVLNPDQVKRIFVEHFARRLLIAHGRVDDFSCARDAPTDEIIDAVNELIGNDRGTGNRAFVHACKDCYHEKRYRLPTDAPRGNAHGVIGAEQDVRPVR